MWAWQGFFFISKGKIKSPLGNLRLKAVAMFVSSCCVEKIKHLSDYVIIGFFLFLFLWDVWSILSDYHNFFEKKWKSEKFGEEIWSISYTKWKIVIKICLLKKMWKCENVNSEKWNRVNGVFSNKFLNLFRKMWKKWKVWLRK